MVNVNRRDFFVVPAGLLAAAGLTTAFFWATGKGPFRYDPIEDADKIIANVYKNGIEWSNREENMTRITERKLNLADIGDRTEVHWVARRFYPSDKPGYERGDEDILQIRSGNELYSIVIEGNADLRRVSPDLKIRDVQNPRIRNERYVVFSGEPSSPQTQTAEVTTRDGRKVLRDLASKLYEL